MSEKDIHDAGREIFRVMKPGNFTAADWDSGAVLGANNEFRNEIMLAAKRVIELCAARAPRSSEIGQVGEELLNAAYEAGWDESGEGYNAEYPGLHGGDETHWINNRDEAIGKILAQLADKGGA